MTMSCGLVDDEGYSLFGRFQHVVTVEARNRQELNGVQVVTEPFKLSSNFSDDFVVTGLGPLYTLISIDEYFLRGKMQDLRT